MKTEAARFVVLFTVLFGLMLLPWPGLQSLYGDYFRALGNLVFEHHTKDVVIFFESHLRKRGHASMDSQIVLCNPLPVNDKGQIRVDELGIDSRSVGWIPTCLTAALILASPFSSKRRILVLGAGLFLIQVYILIVNSIYLLNQATTMGLLDVPAWAGSITNALEYTFVTQLGPGFVIPVLIWLLVCVADGTALKKFHNEDFSLGQHKDRQ